MATRNTHDAKVRMPLDMHQELLKEAKRNQRSLSNQIVYLLREHEELKQKVATK
jgi:hypothetical protein